MRTAFAGRMTGIQQGSISEQNVEHQPRSAFFGVKSKPDHDSSMEQTL